MLNKTYWVTCKLENLTEAEADAVEHSVMATALKMGVDVEIKRKSLNINDANESQEKHSI